MISPTTTETILLVDDRGPLRELMEVILCRTGYRVISAPDGVQALRMAREERFIELLLTSSDVAGMRGEILANRFARLFPEAAVIVTSYSTDVIQAEATYELLPKPFSVGELRDAVRKVLRDRPARSGPVESLPPPPQRRGLLSQKRTTNASPSQPLRISRIHTPLHQ
jgi:DNA-binding NtrC family response regulator